MSESLAFIGDMHIAPPETGADRAQSELDRPARRKARLEAALKGANRLKPAAVFYGGDNTNQPTERPGYREALLPILDSGPRPWRSVPGNHDVGSTVGWDHHDPDSMERSLAAFREAHGADRWVHDAAGFRIIGINSQILGSTLTDAGDQIDWLSSALKEPTSLIRAVFLHTPPYLHDWDDTFTDGSEMMCLRPRAREPLRRVLLASPPDLLISAHAHRYWVRQEPLWWWIGIPATALGQDEMAAVPDHNLPRGDDRVGWVSLTRRGESWITEMHPLH